MKASHLQSLSRRVKNAIAAVHAEIRAEAAELTHDIEFDKPTYSRLSRLQRERRKLETLAVSLKRELKSAFREERAAQVLARAGIYDMTVVDHSAFDGIDEDGTVMYGSLEAVYEGE